MWESAVLDKVCNIYSGNSINAKKKADLYTGVNGVPYIATKDISFDGIIDYDNGVAIPQEDSVSFKAAPENTVFVCAEGGSAGRKIAISDRQVCFVNKLFALVAFDRLLPKFVYYYTLSESFQSQFKDALTGLIGGVSLSKIKKFTINFPSIEEQKRIVAILDEAFAGIDQAIANTEQNIQNARELFESYLNTIFTQKGEGWEKKNLSELAEFKNGLNFSKSSKGESIAVLGVGDFQQRLWAPLSDLEKIQIDGVLPESYELRENDIVVVRSNGNKELIGRSLLVGELEQKTSYSGFTIRVRLNTNDVLPLYLINYLKSGYIHNLMTSAGGGANISNLNQQILSNITVSYPDTAKQSEIVERIFELKEKQSQYIELTTEKLFALKELKQSLLQKAFAGELTSDLSEAA